MHDTILQHDLSESEKAFDKLRSYGLDRLPVSPKSSYSGSLDTVVTVVQKEYAIISASKGDKKIANTFGLADCIGLTLYDKDKKVAAVAHIDGLTNVRDSVVRILEGLSVAGGHNYEARLFGGYKTSAKQLLDIVTVLKQKGVQIVEADILENAESRNIGISVEGDLYNNIFTDKDDSLDSRMQLAGLRPYSPLRCRYRP